MEVNYGNHDLLARRTLGAVENFQSTKRVLSDLMMTSAKSGETLPHQAIKGFLTALIR
ncbi:hypothetical protein X727_23670 [Mesorhizobium sp. L103C119B0]|nr:hypothetical protein X727_23670 [Mesorhizobium sp. L103C119B0]